MPDSASPAFLDTAYIYALVNTRDQWHRQAVQWQRKLTLEQRTLVTTELILVEIADGLAAVKFRTQAAQIIKTLQSSPFVQVVPSSTRLLNDALELYRQRADKDWGFNRLCFIYHDGRTRIIGGVDNRRTFPTGRLSRALTRRLRRA